MLVTFMFAVLSPAPHASANEPVKQEHNHDTDHHDDGANSSSEHFHSYGGEIDHTPVTLNYLKPVKDAEAGPASSWDMPPNEQVPSNSQQTPERPPRS